MDGTTTITHKTSKGEVQQAMNTAIGSTRWEGSNRKDMRWGNLLAARNSFVEHQLHKEMAITIDKFKQLPLREKRTRIEKLAKVFVEEFCEYTRDGGWMQEALGDDFAWIRIEGMSEWHVKAALHSLKGAFEAKGIPPVDERRMRAPSL